MRRSVILALGLVAACTRAIGVGPQPELPQPSAVDPNEGSDASIEALDLRYDEVAMKTTHNAYDREEPLFDQLVYHRIRGLELDIHASKTGVPAPRGDWFVYHADLPLFRDSSCTMLSDCLGQVAAFHAAVPDHEVVTLFVDLKDLFAAGHGVADLDAALVRGLGREAIVTPQDLVDRCQGATSVRGAVTGNCRFPKLADLRGKILVAVTGGSLCDAGSPNSQYVSSFGDREGRRDGALGRAAFVAPDLSASCPIERYDARPEAVFMNMSFSERHRTSAVRDRGLVARLYKGGLVGGLDTPGEFALAAAFGVQLLATDNVNAEAAPWSRTTSVRGWPFRCSTGCDGMVEHADLLGARAASGDLDGDADSFFFAYRPEQEAATWSAFVSVPSSFVDPAAKACLMARAADTPDAPHVALCRPLDQEPPRLLVRRVQGESTSWSAMPEVPGLSPESPAFLRLTVTPTGQGSDVVGEASADGRRWTTIARTVLASALPLRGIALAASGSAPVKGIFGNLTRVVDGKGAVVHAASLLARKGIGRGAVGQLFEGVGP